MSNKTTKKSSIHDRRHRSKFLAIGVFLVLTATIGSIQIMWKHFTVSAGVGDAGNIKITTIRDGDGTGVPDGHFVFQCGGTPVEANDNSLRDLDPLVGVFEITPTEEELTDAECGDGATITTGYQSVNSLYLPQSVQGLYQAGQLNTYALPTILFPLQINVMDQFGQSLTATTITYNSAEATYVSGNQYYWAVAPITAAVVIQRAGYVNAQSTNTGLNTVTVSQDGKTIIQLGEFNARSSAISSAGVKQIKGLQPTVKARILNPNETTYTITAQTVAQKSIDNGATYVPFIPVYTNDNIIYDTADAQYTQTYYRIAVGEGGNYTTVGPFTPSVLVQQVAVVTLPSIRSFSGGVAATTTPTVVIENSDASGAQDVPVLIDTHITDNIDSILTPSQKELLKAKDPTQGYKPVMPEPTVLSSTSIQWNLPNNIPENLLPLNAVLYKVEGGGGLRKLIQLDSKVIVKGVEVGGFIEKDLEVGMTYSNRVLGVEGVRDVFLFPSTTTVQPNPPELRVHEGGGEFPIIVIPIGQYAKTTLVAIQDTQSTMYLHGDGWLYQTPEWRAWYKWGNVVKLPDGQVDGTQRTLRLSNIIAGSYSFVQRIQATPASGDPLSSKTLDVHIP